MSPVAITVVGSVNLDLVARCENLPRAGETVLGGVFDRHPGGKGANQALAAQRLGADVQMLGRVGGDSDAGAALSLLKAEGVDLSNCRALDAAPTGVALIAVSEAGENQIVVAPGANEAFQPSHLPDRIETALIGQLEIPLETVRAAIERCSGFVCMNLAPAMDVPEEMLRRCDLLIVNETEAQFYGQDRLFASGGLVALTLGADGAVLFRDGVEIARAGVPNIDVVDTTGAGDTFAAAITVALLEGRDEQAALEFACTAGAVSTTRQGAQPAIPTRRAVKEWL